MSSTGQWLLTHVRDYDINDAGVGGGGIGFQVLVETFRRSGHVRESAVVSPSQMLAFGDSILTDDTALSGSMNHPIFWANSHFSPAPYYHPQGPFNTPDRVSTQARRHNGKFNVVFCDGHTESLKTNQLFGLKDDVMRLWNRDHEPHLEAWAKFRP